MIDKLPETLHYFYYSTLFPKNFVTITETQSDIIQNFTIDYNNIEIKIYNAENQPFTFTNTQEITNTSPEASPTDNIDNILHSQPMVTNYN